MIVISVVAAAFAIAATVKAGVRLWDLWRDYRHLVPASTDSVAEQRLEVLMTKNLYRAQAVRFSTYLAIITIFVIPLVAGRDNTVWLRTIISLFVLFAFAAEEFYLDRARNRWLSNIRKERSRASAAGKQDKLLEVAETNKLALEQQRELAASALKEQTELTDTVRNNRDALEEQHLRERKSGP